MFFLKPLIVIKYLFCLIHWFVRWNALILIPIFVVVNVFALAICIFDLVGYADQPLGDISSTRKFYFLIACIISTVPAAICFYVGPVAIRFSPKNKILFKYNLFGTQEYKLSSLAYDLLIFGFFVFRVIYEIIVAIMTNNYSGLKIEYYEFIASAFKILNWLF
ncbi:MAG: hypothetical protein MR964_02825 [Campylobacter sp.]|uniref:hypothetical protein n=1 Tax=Campylobacter sp. TaxID=205 RepID=UPI002AA8F8A7|nr:hypothetical protein [Campylobacter sp.]MCI7023156.1 hypothetical protein [Campylobacter sp.]